VLLIPGMQGMHSISKGEREVIRQLVHSVLVRDMASFNPERFRDWIKALDTSFRKVGLTLTFKINDRTVHFVVKQLRGGPGGGRVIYQFASSTHVKFDDNEVAPLTVSSAGN
jgi:hypothetical protein